MTDADIDTVDALAKIIHPKFPEEREVFQEKSSLYPKGCFMCEEDGKCVGYAITHPWPYEAAPPLDEPLGSVPPDGDAYYFHDIALLEEFRGKGRGLKIIAQIKDEVRGAGYKTAGMVAVNMTMSTWAKVGFYVKDVPALREKVKAYEECAAYMQCDL
jgi:GNAT superfamily N-acetyltransferase